MHSKQRLQIAITMLAGLAAAIGLGTITLGPTCRPDFSTLSCDRSDPELTKYIR